MSDITIAITDNSDQVLAEFQQQILKALTITGMTAEGYAKELCPHDTGRLRSSITNQVDTGDKSVVIGTNVEYGKYVELGTGIHAESGGRQTPWVYKDDAGNWHITKGMRAKPFLKPAVANHTGEYSEIIQDTLKNG